MTKQVVRGKSEMNDYPIDSCEKCRQIYWACACGASPIGSIVHKVEDAGPQPERCNNVHHEPGREDLPMNIRLVIDVFCCQSYNHHLGGRCSHCGNRN